MALSVDRNPRLYRHRREYDVRFSDLDIYHHVNNKAYLAWIEDARVRYLLEAAQFRRGMEEGPHGIMVVHVALDYISQVEAFQMVTILTRCTALGTRSFTLHHLVQVEDRLAAAGETVFASMDRTTGTSRPNDREMVAAIRAWELCPPQG